MSGFNQVLIGGYPGGGLTTDRKPLMLANEAFSQLQNAYVWRERTIKRLGINGIGQLSRVFTTINFFLSAVSWNFNLLTRSGYVAAANNANPGKITTTYPHQLTTGDKVIITGIVGATGYNNVTFTIAVVDALNFTVGVNAAGFGAYVSGGFFISNRAWGTLQPGASLVPGSVVVTIASGPIVLTDQGNGTLTSPTGGNSGTINYATGAISITDTAPANTASTVSFSYYPGLQSMGILKRDVAVLGIESTIFFDTVYAYQFVGGMFQELAPGTAWSGPNNANGTNTFYFWGANYQGATPNLRYFFVTNDNITLGAATPYDPIYYYDNSVWNVYQPILADNPPSAAQTLLYQALLIVPYYGRLLALNTWEGTTAGGPGGAVNFFQRVRFSQIGDPLAADAWRSDKFGLGGFLDAPTNESIVSVAFYRNTLIVFFEYSTWQLRYIGEYGLPFIFERISSDFGAISTFSPIIFDQGVMAVGDRGIVEASAAGVKRMDEQIPETAFAFEIQDNAPDFVHGARDFEKEIVYWNYYDTTDPGLFQEFPNTTLLFNYKNNTWAQFRDTITCFGPAQFQFGITWDSLTTFWDSNVSWDSSDDQQYVDYVTCGNQQGYISIYENPEAATPTQNITMFAPCLSISAFNLGVSPNQLTVLNHNLVDGEFVYLTGAMWTPSDPGFNNFIYKVQVVDQNSITLLLWSQAALDYSQVTKVSASTYIGGGRLALLPVMNIVGKDFNPYQSAGKQFKISYIDFQLDSNDQFPSIPAVSVQLYVNSRLNDQANIIGNQEVLNSSQDVGFILGATQASPCVITSPGHSLVTGAVIYIANVQGMTQLNTTNYIITVVDADSFSLNVDSTGFSTYTGGGIWNTLPNDGQTYIPGSQYAWYRFYSTQFGQYLRITLTYDDVLMNQLATHQTPMELNAMMCWFREGGRLVN